MKKYFTLVLVALAMIGYNAFGQSNTPKDQEGDTTSIPAKTAFYISSPFPNPVTDFLVFTYRIPSHSRQASVHLYDLTGRKLAIFELKGSSGQTRINMENYKNGIFFYTLYVDTMAIKTGRFIKKSES